MDLNKISVLHITNNLGIGGVQKIIYEICNASKDRMNTIVIASSGGEYVSRIEKLGIEHITIPDLSTKNPKEIIEIYKILKNTIGRYHINLIHCHHRMAVSFARMLISKQRVIYNNHTIYSDKKLFSHFVLNGVNIIADGEKAKENVTNFFKVSKNITVINNAVDDFDGVVNPILEIEEAKNSGKFIVMNSARLHPQKGMNYFIDAADILIKKGLNIKFFIVGDGPLREELTNQVSKKSLQENVIFLGFRTDIKSVISQCDLLVLTSVYEGLPLTPMEAFSVRKAVVGTNIDGTREVIKNNYNGLLAESKNPIDIADKISLLYHDKELLNAFCQNAYLTYKNLFSIACLEKSYLEFYSSII